MDSEAHEPEHEHQPRREPHYDVIERLKAACNPPSYYQLAKRLHKMPAQITRWRKRGYIPEENALDVADLGLFDRYGLIGAMDVLRQARMVKRGEGVPLLPIYRDDDEYDNYPDEEAHQDERV